MCLCKSCRCSSLSAGKRDAKSCMTQGAIHQLHSHSLLLAFCRVGHKMKTHGKSHLWRGAEWTSCEIAAVPLSPHHLKSFCCFHHHRFILGEFSLHLVHVPLKKRGGPVQRELKTHRLQTALTFSRKIQRNMRTKFIFL